MMALVIITIFAAAFYPITEQLWTRYLAVMCLRRASKLGLLPKEAEPYAKVSAAVGWAFDCLYQFTYACIVFIDIPREFTVSARLERYIYGKAYRLRIVEADKWWRRLKAIEIKVKPATGWRLKLALWFARNMLDPYPHDGPHLKP